MCAIKSSTDVQQSVVKTESTIDSEKVEVSKNAENEKKEEPIKEVKSTQIRSRNDHENYSS